MSHEQFAPGVMHAFRPHDEDRLHRIQPARSRDQIDTIHIQRGEWERVGLRLHRQDRMSTCPHGEAQCSESPERCSRRSGALKRAWRHTAACSRSPRPHSARNRLRFPWLPSLRRRRGRAEVRHPNIPVTAQLKLPEHYREWVYLTSGFDMSYNRPPCRWMDHHMFDNVFVNPAVLQGVCKDRYLAG